MAVEHNTAANYADLLDRLVTFLTTNADLVAVGQEWTVLRDQNPTTSSPGAERVREVQLRAPGLAGIDAFYMGIISTANPGQDRYGLVYRGSVGYLDSVSWDAQPQISPAVALPLWNDSMPYWFMADGRSVRIVVKVSTVYESGLLGAGMLPYATGAQYPYPLTIGGMVADSTRRWSDNSPAHKAWWDPAGATLWVYYLDGTWLNFYNTDDGGGRQIIRNVWPFEGGTEIRGVVTTMRENVDGSYTLIPLELHMSSPGNILGKLDGVYFVSGAANAAENTITIDGIQYLVVQNAFRTDRWNYAAFRLA